MAKSSSAQKRAWRWGLLLLLPISVVIAANVLLTTKQPVYQGKTLRQWMRGHSTEYIPAVQAMGTNAIPFLLSELQSKDLPLAELAQDAFRLLLHSPPPWETAGIRRYHGRLALQVLDTNALPALLHAFFREPFQIRVSHITWEIATTFNWLASPQAREQLRQALSKAMQDPDRQKRRNACLAFYAGSRGNDSEIRQLAALTRDSEPLLRAAATRALLVWQTNEFGVIPALIARLEDPQAAIRHLAAEALGARKTNAITALPALLAAYTNEPTHTTLRDDLDHVLRGRSVHSVQNTQGAILEAIRSIAPGTPLPGAGQ